MARKPLTEEQKRHKREYSKQRRARLKLIQGGVDVDGNVAQRPKRKHTERKQRGPYNTTSSLPPVADITPMGRKPTRREQLLSYCDRYGLDPRNYIGDDVA